MKRVVVMTTLVMLASSVAQGQMSNQAIVQDAKAEQESRASQRTAQKDRAREECATQDEAGEPALPVAPDEAVASTSRPKKQPLLSPEEVAKAPLGDGLSAPDSQPNPGENDVIIPPMFGDFSVRWPPDKPTLTTSVSTGHFKIAENESPRPQNRVYIVYNGYYDVIGPMKNQHLETIGLEKTFLKGNASIGLRSAFYQQQGPPDVRGSGFADLSFILKYAPINNRETGNVLSTGLVMTVPTGQGLIRLPPGVKEADRPFWFQPFLGYLKNRKNFFVQGFSGLAIPSNSRAATILFNDIGIGYWAYRGASNSNLTGIVPTFEFHVNTPLNNRTRRPGREDFHDVVDFTPGVHFVFKRRSSLGLAVAIPVNHIRGPFGRERPFGAEAIISYNFWFK
ncbi:MAG: hypothetical protein ACR2HX_20860 [Pyrinomonadaceae bacterium]